VLARWKLTFGAILLLVVSAVTILFLGRQFDWPILTRDTAKTGGLPVDSIEQDRQQPKPTGLTNSRSLPKPVTSPIRFIESARELGISFRQTSGITRDKHFPAANGSGAALLDANADGLLDIYFLTACLLPIKQSDDSPRNEFYRAKPEGSYEELAAMAGLDFAGFSQGVGVADVNNDGFSDLYVVTLGGNLLFQNMGDGTYRNVTDQSGTGSGRWGTSCAFLDYDEDGTVDLYVANYGIWSIETNEYCGDRERGIRLFCRPTYITPAIHLLLRNRGDGTFEETTEQAGIARTDGRGQGVVAADLNGDGHMDLYVANDMSPNFLFLNRGDGTFHDASILSGAAFDGDGAALASMGVDATDVDGDGRPELFVTNFLNEYNNLYHNQGKGFFEDISVSSGLGPDSLPEVGWGTLLTDLDNDGLPDVLVVNGHVDDNTLEFGRNEPYQQKAKVWRNKTGLRFDNVSSGAGDYFSSAHLSRGAAFGDLNNDGRTDVVVLNLDEPATVLINESTDASGWIRLELVGRSSNRDSIGSLIEAEIRGRKLVREIKGGGSYLSAHDLRLLIGIGNATQADRVLIRWLGGESAVFEGVSPQQTIRAIEPLR